MLRLIMRDIRRYWQRLRVEHRRLSICPKVGDRVRFESIYKDYYEYGTVYGTDGPNFLIEGADGARFERPRKSVVYADLLKSDIL